MLPSSHACKHYARTGIRLVTAAVTLPLLSGPALAEVPPSMLGTWDVSTEACSQSFAYSTTKLGVGRDRLRFHYGHADIAETERQGDVLFVRGDLSQEGQAEPGARTAHYRLEHLNGTDTLGFKRENMERQDLVRCASDEERVGRDDAPRHAPVSPNAAGSGTGVGFCGHYVLLGAAPTLGEAFDLQNRLGARKAGVISNDEVPAFRDGYHSIILGPFATRGEAEARLGDWQGRVPDAYVKRGCDERSEADGTTDRLPDTLPLREGTYVRAGSGCEAPANAARRRFDGRGIAGSVTRDCRADILSRSGETFEVSQSCVNTYDGSRTSERQTITVPAEDRFRLATPDGEAGMFELCSTSP